MSHQPFEHWILDGEVLSSGDRRALQAHLDACPGCSRLQQNWHELHGTLRVQSMLAPAPGFTSRWQAGLTERRAKAQRRQAWKIFGLFVATALLTGLILTGYTMATSSPTDWIETIVHFIGSLAGLVGFGSSLVHIWFNNTTLGITLAIWIYLTICLCLISLVWVAVVWRTHLLGVFNR